MKTFTAAEISRASGTISRQGVAKLLAGVKSDGVRSVRGNQETSAWLYASLPDALRQRLETDARRQGYRNAETLLATPPHRWSPSVPLRDVAEEELTAAAKMRDVLAPFLRNQSRPAAERDALLVARYGDAFGHVITTDYARKLYQRTLDRDAGVGDFGRLEIYLSESPCRKAAPAWSETVSNLADTLPALEIRLASIATPGHPPKAVVRAVWHVAFAEYTRLVSQGAPADRAARLVRDFLSARAPFLPRNRDTLLKLWNSKLDRWLINEGMPGALVDQRAVNGKNIEVDPEDVSKLRHSAAILNGGKRISGKIYAHIDTAWTEEYDKLSEATRRLGTKYGRCPRSIVRALNRIELEAIAARHHGRRTLNGLLGKAKFDGSALRTHARWVSDDLTVDVEVEEQGALFQPQVIAFMDTASEYVVGWAMSADKGPTGELAYEAFCDAVRSTAVIPHIVGLENGWVFGRSTRLNGKYGSSGEVISAGLAEYGCDVQHFTPGDPTAKAELEKGFDFIQRLMKRLPGYAGSSQRFNAPEQFRREQIEMRRKLNPRDPATCRFSFDQFHPVMEQIFQEYNNTPRKSGRLKGMSPKTAYLTLQDSSNPPIVITPELIAMLYPKDLVTVKNHGVGPINIFGQEIRVRGGRLVDYVGKQLWAVVNNRRADCVTFMTLDFSEVFIEPIRPTPGKPLTRADLQTEPFQVERRTKAQHRQHVETEYQKLISRYGDPRKDLLPAAAANGRLLDLDPNYAAALKEADRLRAEFRDEQAASKTTKRDVTPEGQHRPGFDAAAASIFGTDNSHDASQEKTP